MSEMPEFLTEERLKDKIRHDVALIADLVQQIETPEQFEAIIAQVPEHAREQVRALLAPQLPFDVTPAPADQ